MMNNAPSGTKKHHKSSKPESRQMAFLSSSSSSSSDGPVQNCATLSGWFTHKWQHFTPSIARAHRFFTGLKSHDWGACELASFSTPFSSRVCMRKITYQWNVSIVFAGLQIQLVYMECLKRALSGQWFFFNQYCIHLLRKPEDRLAALW